MFADIIYNQIFLACAFGAFCLYWKESINWRSEQMGYDLEESLQKKNTCMLEIEHTGSKA